MVGGSNYGPFEGIADGGATTGVSGPLNALVDYNGFVFLPKTADRHDAAVELATTENTCPSGGGAGLHSMPDPAAAEVAKTGVAAMISGDSTAFNAQMSDSSIQFRRTGSSAEVRDVQVCHKAGNGAVVLVYLTATFAAADAAGQQDYMAIVVRERNAWKILAASNDPISTPQASLTPEALARAGDPAGGALLTAIDSLGAQASGAVADPQLTLLSPGDGQNAQPAASERFGDYKWSIAGTRVRSSRS